MRSKTVIMIALALVFASMAVLTGHKWLDRLSSQRLREIQVVKPVSTRTIVVAAVPLKFGTEITRKQLAELPWPGEAVPKGAFATFDEVLDGKGRRVALAAIEENEPILSAKITGPGQRASLAALIGEGMKAVTVRVNDVLGVAGFVLPGERVDVLLTRTLDKGEAFADVLLQNVKVLAVDQSADERADKPAVVKAVTLEVATAEAQKLSLASSVGTLSLALRAAGTANAEATRRVLVEDLTRAADPDRLNTVLAAMGAVTIPEKRRMTTEVGVTRAMKRQEYSVPVQGGR